MGCVPSIPLPEIKATAQETLYVLNRQHLLLLAGLTGFVAQCADAKVMPSLVYLAGKSLYLTNSPTKAGVDKAIEAVEQVERCLNADPIFYPNGLDSVFIDASSVILTLVKSWEADKNMLRAVLNQEHIANEDTEPVPSKPKVPVSEEDKPAIQHRAFLTVDGATDDMQHLLRRVFTLLDASIQNKDQNRSLKTLFQELFAELTSGWSHQAFEYFIDGDMADASEHFLTRYKLNPSKP